jgi:hypothetical protein
MPLLYGCPVVCKHHRALQQCEEQQARMHRPVRDDLRVCARILRIAHTYVYGRELLLDEVTSWLKAAHMLGVELEHAPSEKLVTAIAGCSSIDELCQLLGIDADPADEADEAALQLLFNGMAQPCRTPPTVDQPAPPPPVHVPLPELSRDAAFIIAFIAFVAFVVFAAAVRRPLLALPPASAGIAADSYSARRMRRQVMLQQRTSSRRHHTRQGQSKTRSGRPWGPSVLV